MQVQKLLYSMHHDSVQLLIQEVFRTTKVEAFEAASHLPMLSFLSWTKYTETDCDFIQKMRSSQ